MQFVEQKLIKINIKILKNNIMDRLILGPVVPTFGSVVKKAAGYGAQFAKMQDLINSGVLGTLGAGIRNFIPIDGGTISEIVVTPNGNYLPEQQNVQPVIIEENIIPQELNTYDRIEIEDPRKPKTYYTSIEKMDDGGTINTPTIPTFSPLSYNNNYFSSNLYLPVVSGRKSDRILNRIDRRANRAADRIESGNMNINRWDRLGNQYAKDVRRLNEINSTQWSGYLPEEVTNPKEVVMNYLSNIGLNEFKNRKIYPWHH